MTSIAYGLKGQVALVTGGSRGIGLEIARSLLDEGARVILCARKKEGLEAAARALQGGENLLAAQAHIAHEDQVRDLFDRIEREFGGLDILVNSVGMNLMTLSTAEAEYGQWQKIIDSNLNGAFLCCRAAAQIMKKRSRGKIVNITSIAGHRAAAGMGIYGVAKAGIEMLTRVLASELAFFNIQVNAVAPGMVRTDFSRVFWSNEEIYKELTRRIPLGRIAEIRDVVHPVLFLASSGSDYITGQVLTVDGGATVV